MADTPSWHVPLAARTNEAPCHSRLRSASSHDADSAAADTNIGAANDGSAGGTCASCDDNDEQDASMTPLLSMRVPADGRIALALDGPMRAAGVWPPLARHMVLARLVMRSDDTATRAYAKATRRHPPTASPAAGATDNAPSTLALYAATTVPLTAARVVGAGLPPPFGRARMRYTVFSPDRASISVPDLGWTLRVRLAWAVRSALLARRRACSRSSLFCPALI
jgi:hypothetical protein